MRRISLVLVSISTAFLWSCSCENTVPRNVLQVGNGAEVQELDPHTVTGVAEHPRFVGIV